LEGYKRESHIHIRQLFLNSIHALEKKKGFWAFTFLKGKVGTIHGHHEAEREAHVYG